MASQLPTVLLREDAVTQFNENILPLVIEQFEQDGQFDECARSEAWNDWTDSLCKNGIISDWQYENWTHPATCG